MIDEEFYPGPDEDWEANPICSHVSVDTSAWSHNSSLFDFFNTPTGNTSSGANTSYISIEQEGHY